MNSAIRPPPFLQRPDVPVGPWPQLRCAFQTYIDAAARYATPDHQKALLLNALGVELLGLYFRDVDAGTAVRSTTNPSTTNCHSELKVLFAPREDAVLTRLRFRQRMQQPGETAAPFI
ncbi:hypothetical protein HPB50_014869 [Hyalomma asiaticum]|uniref:Uncharacterized protein n=1 Tax=Hyalomma asiaticum TaxID=266040 RepID=A0ACB7TI58_HYAAI|nr:hypothetical protein HPB50_014869 [Hyalomma asiaticum]